MHQSLPERATDKPPAPAPQPMYKTLEARVRGQVKRLRYTLAFVEAYEAEGWRHASREKLKPSQELANATAKILLDKRAVVETLTELQSLHASDTQYPHLAASATALHLPLPEDIYCSRCGSTDAADDNDILICDSDGCARAYHQQCQSPPVATKDIPAGDELWYCEVCLAVFKSLKLVNSTFGTTYDTVSELFPELRDSASQAPGGALRDGLDDDEDDDDDFEPANGDDDGDDDGSDDSESSDDGNDDGDASGALSGSSPLPPATLVEEHVSDQELQYLRKSDVIDEHRRSMRSRSTAQTQATEAIVLGQRVAKIDAATGSVVLGVLVDYRAPLWEVIYYDDTTAMLETRDAVAAVARAKALDATPQQQQPPEQKLLGERDDGDVMDPALIVHGKRKRTQVNYRALNDALFAGKADSDEEAEASDSGDRQTNGAEYHDDASDDSDDYVPRATKKTSNSNASASASASAGEGTTRSRRARKSVDYHALNEGLLSC